MNKTFEQDTLDTLDRTAEIDIETSRGEGAPARRTTIWTVVDGDTVYIRSVAGPSGRWYRRLVANPFGAVHVDGKRIPVQAFAAADAETIARVSDALNKKYLERWPGPTAAMLREDTLPTTLRLEPR